MTAPGATQAVDDEALRAARSESTATFIRANLRVSRAPALPEISLHMAHPASRLWRLATARTAAPPYWAYHWAGGTVLARYILDRPETVAGRRVLDLGAGSGVVGIAAAKAGAAAVLAADIDPNAQVAIGMNGALNDVTITALCRDVTFGAAADVDLVLVGDLFYERVLARRVTAFLARCRAGGLDALVGDPRRAHLPTKRLRCLAEYRVPDFGGAGAAAPTLSGVFAFGDEPVGHA